MSSRVEVVRDALTLILCAARADLTRSAATPSGMTW